MKNLTKLLVSFVLFHHLASNVYGAFEEVPRSQQVSNGDSATFRCHHQSADTIRWRVDHALITANPSPDITPTIVREGDHIVHTLTIVARPEYNGTVVECVAMFDDHTPDEQTAPAVLHVLVVVDGLVGQFIQIPSSQNLTLGETAAFVCRHRSADHIIWEVTPRWLYDQFEQASRGGEYTLSAHLEDGIDYNATTVQCVAVLDDSHLISSEPATLLVQEPLDPVGDLHENKTSSTLYWYPPLSLDLTNADPDIAYCVDVYNITCGRRDHIVSDCNLMEPSYTRHINSNGYIYEHVITPRSNVREASNGTSLSLKDEYPVLNSSEVENLRGFRAHLAITVDSEVQSVLPSFCTLSLESMDEQTDTHHVMITADKNESSIFFDLSGVPLRQLFTCKIFAYRCTDDSSLLAAFDLSTHDAQNISVVPISNGILISGHYIDNSEAKGLLVIVHNMSDPDQYPPQYRLIPRYNESSPKKQKIQYRLTELGIGEQLVSVFVVEKGGLPFSRVATRPKTVLIPNSSSEVQSSLFIKYSIQSTSDCVNITCDFKQTSSATDCLVIVHQQISLVNTTGLMNIEVNWTQRLTRHGDTASGCIPGIDLDLYQIGVANGRKISVVLMSAPKVEMYIIAAVITMVIVLLLGLVLLIIIKIIMMHNRNRATEHRAVKNKLVIMKRTATRNWYVDLSPATHQESNTKLVDNSMEMGTFISNATMMLPSAQCEVQFNKGDDDPTDGCGGVNEESPNEEYQTQGQAQCHDSSGIVSQELYPSKSESASGSDKSPCNCEPVEVMDQCIKIAADLDMTMESVISESLNLIPQAVKGFGVLSEDPCLPEPKEASSLGGVSPKAYQPVTAQPLPHDKPGDEVVLPRRRRSSSLEVRQDFTEIKGQVEEFGTDTDKELKTGDEIVTGVRKNKD